jgi:hypothetical protein
MVIRYDGNVGIGIANPTTILQLSSADGVDPRIVTGRTAARANGSEYTVAALEAYFVTRDGVQNLGGFIRINDYNTNPAYPVTIRGGRIVFGTVDGGSGASAQASEKMTILANGNVGIGTTNPGASLDVQGGAIRVWGSPTNSGTIEFKRTNDGWNPATIQQQYNTGSYGGDLAFQLHPADNIAGTAPATVMYLKAGGNVGIGTTSPNGPLEVQNQSSATTVENLWLTAPNLTAGQQSRFFWGKNTGSYNGGYFYYYHYGDGSTANYFRLDFNGKNNVLCAAATGNVGIGTSSPGYTLDVNTSSSAVGWTGYMWYNNSTGNPATSGTDFIAVNANGSYRTTSGGFLRVSDVRIKKNIQPISSVIDTVLQLKPCTFQYIDEARLGTQTINGFIAQEVEKVLPGVVNKTGTGHVPDVYCKGRVQGATIMLEAPPRNANLTGQKIQVYYSDTSNTEVSVEANVTNFTDSTITLDTEIPSQTCFVYGTYTNAMYSVANESMVPTLVAAIQELSVENKALEARLAALEAKLAA